MQGSIWIRTKDKRVNYFIEYLSNRFNSYYFFPHITLVNGIVSNYKDRLIELAKIIKDNFQPFTLKFKKIEYSNIFTQSLYLTFYSNNLLLKLRSKSEEIIDNFKLNFNYKFKPHLSLIYADISDKEKIKIIKEIEFKIPKEIHFNDLLLLIEEKPIENTQDVKNWKYIEV